MKEYTSFLIHNMTSTIDYFDSKCNSEIDAQCEADGEQNEENTNVQSFPCYYESLHKMCRISPNETRYNKYSMPEKKINLKCYQALLRIFKLSESTYCRLQTKEFNYRKYDKFYIEIKKCFFFTNCILYKICTINFN